MSGVPGYFAIASDFNGDGKLDIGYAAYYSSQFYLAFGKGDGTFQGGTTLVTDAYSSVAAAADFNGDGRPDLAIANSGSSSINVFQGGFFSGLTVSSSHAANFITGGTGAYQLVVNNPSYTATSGTVTVSDTLPAGLTAIAMSGSGWACSIGTLSCTRSDSLANNSSYPAVTLTVNVSASLAPTTLTNRASVVFSNVNNSVTDATAIVSPTVTSLVALPNPAVLGQAVTLTASVSGGATGFVAFFDGSTPIGSAALAGGQATLVTRSLAAGARSLRARYPGDATHGLSTSAVSVETVNAGQSSGLNSGNSYAVGTNPKAIAMADFNGDGKADLVTANSGSSNISVLTGGGNGTFAAKVDYPVGGPAVALVVADFNNDGRLDVAVAVNAAASNLAVLLGNGNGTFQQALYYSLPNALSFIAASDFNLDGKTDLLLVANGDLSLLLGNGDGTFQTRQSVGNYSSQTVVIGDFNGDGKTDIALGYYSAAVLLGNGDGTFQYGLNSSGNCAGNFSAGDINGDGKADLVCGDANNGVSVSLGKGDGTFQPSVHYSAGASTGWTSLADLNGDGKLDVIVTLSSGSTIAVFLGNGDGTLQAPVSYTVGSQPAAIAAGDFNGDGRTDLAVANSGSNNVSVLVGVLTPVISVSAGHKGSYYLGQTGAVFTITVTNNGPGVTSGTVTFTDTLPSVFTAASINGAGWACTLSPVSCTRSDSLAAGTSYPTITVLVNVASVVSSPVLNIASVSGGGSPSALSSDSIEVNSPPVALRFIPVTPCRVVDTRNATSAFGGPILSGGAARTFTIPAGSCGIPSTAQAYSLNLAVVPPGPLGFVTVWPAGQSRPQTSNLNSLDGRIKSNAVIASAGTAGAISVYASDATHVVLDINGYFVPATDPNGLAFYPVTPCRIADTRNTNAPLAGPALVGGQTRTFPVQSSTCNIPANARAYSLNFTAVPRGAMGFLAAWPTGQPQPLVSSLNALTGAVTANAAIVPAGTAGSIDLYASDTTDLVIDINGYFAPAAAGGLSLYNVAPCRVLDTRTSGFVQFSGIMNVNVPGSGCGIPMAAQAFVFSAVVVPPGGLGFLTLWPQAQPQPYVSTLNAADGAITSNLAIVPAAVGGSISAYASATTHLILDLFGYMAP